MVAIKRCPTRSGRVLHRWVVAPALVAGLLVCSGRLIARTPVRLTIDATTGPVTVLAEVAETDAARARGLMGRRSLPPGRGMWFVFPTDVRHPFWMKNTYVPLDIIFVGADGKIVDIIANARPLSEQNLIPRAAYRYVLEVGAGFAAGRGIMPGDTVVVKRARFSHCRGICLASSSRQFSGLDYSTERFKRAGFFRSARI